MHSINQLRTAFSNADPELPELRHLAEAEDTLVRPGFEALQSLKREIAREKRSALAEIDARFRDRLDSARAHYQIMLTMIRGN
jgi:hypothetical protein